MQSKVGLTFLILALTFTYAISGQVGIYLQGETRGITSLWPPSGVAAFFIYRFGYRVWPGIIFGLFYVAYFLGESVPYSPFLMLQLSLANISEAVLITYFLKKNHFSPFFSETKSLYSLYFWGVILFPGLTALIGSSLLYFHGHLLLDEWQLAFSGWWLGNSMGILMLFPLGLVWSWYPAKYYRFRKRKLFELIIISLFVIYLLLLEDAFGKDNHFQLFFSFLLIIFCSIRYLQHGVTIVSLILSISIILQNRQTDGIPLELSKVIDQEIFIALIYMTGFYIATVLRAQSEAQRVFFREKIYAETTLNSIYDSVIVTNSGGIIISVNPSVEKLLEKSESELIGKPLDKVLRIRAESTNDDLTDLLIQDIRQNRLDFPEKELVLELQNGFKNIELYLAPIRIEHKHSQYAKSHHLHKLKGCALTIRDVSRSHKLKQQLNYQASHDYLTGLINRRDFEERLKNAINAQAYVASQHTLLFIDLDRFKIVNDTCGHIAGDQILKSAATLVQQSLRKNDLLARLGGDEFGVLLTDCDSIKGLDIANKIRKLVDNHSFKWGDNHFNLSVSIGLTTIKDNSKNVQDVMREADIACYEAKDAGKNVVFEYKGSENSNRETEMQWLSRIIKAIDRQQFELFVQPIVFSQSLDVNHYEVLLRLKLEDGQIISPAVFIPAAERHGAMAKIDKWVVEQAIHWLKNNNNKNISLAVNLSGASLGNLEFCEYLKTKIGNSCLPPHQLCFEITETSAIKNYETAQYFIKCSKEYGVSFALDDFGSGLSSFAYLKSFPVDYLKIDGSFVKEMATSPVDKAMVQAIHQVGKVMGIKTIAEFVEDDAIIKECQSLGIDMLQGFGIEKPKPMKDI